MLEEYVLKHGRKKLEFGCVYLNNNTDQTTVKQAFGHLLEVLVSNKSNVSVHGKLSTFWIPLEIRFSNESSENWLPGNLRRDTRCQKIFTSSLLNFKSLHLKMLLQKMVYLQSFVYVTPFWLVFSFPLTVVDGHISI